VLVDRNLIPTGGTLPDGRPIYDPIVSSGSRVDPGFDHIDRVESIAHSRYDGLVMSLRTRPFDALTVESHYTWSRALDNGPLTNAYVQASRDDRLSDPSNVDRDWGRTPFDQQHTFALVSVLQPAVARGRLATLLNGFSLGTTVRAASGLHANVRSNRDLNRDGRLNDRPTGFSRNSGSAGNNVSVDLKATERFWRSGRTSAEVFVSVKNLFDAVNPAGVNRIVATTLDGTPLAPVPDPLPATETMSPRRAQVGFLLRF